ncbi:MAG: hypothetical protein KBF12_09150 [Sebaldella sp.]|nr:hypothetical protein [Sebaldella sp.]
MKKKFKISVEQNRNLEMKASKMTITYSEDEMKAKKNKALEVILEDEKFINTLKKLSKE